MQRYCLNPAISRTQKGFSLIEVMIAMTITLIVTGLAFSLLAGTLRQRIRAEDESAALSDANQSLTWMSMEIMNAGFGLKTNGLVAADCNEEQIRIRANLNAFLQQTTSGTVADQDEDVIYRLAPNPDGTSSLVRSDVALSRSTIIATRVDNVDIDGDGDGDGLTFTYLNSSGTVTTPDQATRVTILVRIILPQIGTPGSDGYQPQRTKAVTSSVVLRNSQLVAY